MTGKDSITTIDEQLMLIADQLFEKIQSNIAEHITDPDSLEMCAIANYHFAIIAGGLGHAIKYCFEQEDTRLSPFILFDVMIHALKETLQALPPVAAFEDEKNLMLDVINTTMKLGRACMAEFKKQKEQPKVLH